MLAALARFDAAISLESVVGALARSNVVAILAYVLFLAVPLYLVARNGRRETE